VAARTRRPTTGDGFSVAVLPVGALLDRLRDRDVEDARRGGDVVDAPEVLDERVVLGHVVDADAPGADALLEDGAPVGGRPLVEDRHDLHVVAGIRGVQFQHVVGRRVADRDTGPVRLVPDADVVVAHDAADALRDAGFVPPDSNRPVLEHLVCGRPLGVSQRLVVGDVGIVADLVVADPDEFELLDGLVGRDRRRRLVRSPRELDVLEPTDRERHVRDAAAAGLKVDTTIRLGGIRDEFVEVGTGDADCRTVLDLVGGDGLGVESVLAGARRRRVRRLGERGGDRLAAGECGERRRATGPEEGSA
jgi:hypothetical protein